MLNLSDLAWHRSVGSVLDALDQHDFWLRLTRLLANFVHFDSWVALGFSEGARPVVLAEMPSEDGMPDTLFEDYLRGLYLLDPFFISMRECRRAGLVHLDEVAPDRFSSTEYYQRYFRLNIVEDEIQFNCPVEQDATFCLSLGSHRKFLPADLALLSLLGQWVVPLLRQRRRHEMKILVSEPIANGTPAFRLKEASLSARELEISRLMLSGFSSKGIAQRLKISAETVKVHRKHLYSKLGISSQSELFALFVSDTVRGHSA